MYTHTHESLSLFEKFHSRLTLLRTHQEVIKMPILLLSFALLPPSSSAGDLNQNTSSTIVQPLTEVLQPAEGISAPTVQILAEKYNLKHKILKLPDLISSSSFVQNEQECHDTIISVVKDISTNVLSNNSNANFLHAHCFSKSIQKSTPL